MKTSILLFLFLSLHIVVCGQTQQEKLIQQVLKNNIPRRTYDFDMKDKEKTQYRIKYIGTDTLKSGEKYKIINMETYSVPVGLTKHGHGVILIYTDKNKFAGAYHVDDPLKLPDYLDKGKLVFVAKFQCTETTKIDVVKELPKQIYIKCNRRGGDVYSFTTEYPFF